MTGFNISIALNSNWKKSDQNQHYQVVQQGCWQQKVAEDKFLIVFGYFWGVSKEQFIELITFKRFDRLSEVDGHFCGVLIDGIDVFAFVDRLGGKSLFWQNRQGQLQISSHFKSLSHLTDTHLDRQALSDYQRFRWLTGSNTISPLIKTLPAHHVVQLNLPEVVPLSYWHLPAPKLSNDTFEQQVENTKQFLIKSLQKTRLRHQNVAIFLSGGVDSSLLAYLCKSIFERCVLITPYFEGGANEELDTAIAFAKILELEHKIVNVSLQSVKPTLVTLLKQGKEPLRHYSSIAMLAMMEAIEPEFTGVVYGEGADTLFGSNGIKRTVKSIYLHRILSFVPNFALSLVNIVTPKKAKILAIIKAKKTVEFVEDINAIRYRKSAQKLLEKNNVGKSLSSIFNPKNFKTLFTERLRNRIMQHVIDHECSKHFQETERIAELYNKEVISPFLALDIIQLSTSLPNKYYYGKQWIKPILRTLACEAYPRTLIYQDKHGFPVPFIRWLQDPLKDLVENLYSESALFDGKRLKELDVEEDYELFWLIINGRIIHQDIFSKK